MNPKKPQPTINRIITTLIATTSIILGACTMANLTTANTPKAEDESFSVRFLGGQRYASNGMAAWLSGRVRMGLFDTATMKDFNGVGIIESQLSSDDLREAKDIHREICRALSGSPSTAPQWFGEYTMFSIHCIEQGKRVGHQIDLNKLPQELSTRAIRFEETIIKNYKNDARPLVKFDVAVNNIQRQGHRFLVSVNFINHGRHTVSMQSPDQWRQGFPYRLWVSGIRTDGEGEWHAELAGLPVENKAEFSIKEIDIMGKIDTYLSIPPGQSITLKFLAVPKGKVPHGTYRFGALVDASLSAKGVYPSIGRATFISDRNKPTTITFERDYPSTAEEWEDYEAPQRKAMSSHPVQPGQKVAEAGHYRLTSASGQRSRFVFSLNQGVTARECRDEVDEHGKPMSGKLSWQWEADMARDIYGRSDQPCPRTGHWIAFEWGAALSGPDSIRLLSKSARKFRAGDILPVVPSNSSVVHTYTSWQWLGA